MPTYEYRCKDCGDELDVVQSFSDDALDTCPTCGGALRKKFAAPGISFRGSGFYKTDSRGSTTSPSNGTSTSTDSSDSTSSSTSNDSSSTSSSSADGDGGSKSSSSSSSSNGSSGTGAGAGSSSGSGSKAATPA